MTTYQELLKCFVTYLRVKWKWLGLPKPTQLQEEMAEYLQQSNDRKMLSGFRGIAKTWVTSSLCEWLWLRERDYRILLVSGNQRKADEISNFIRTSIDNFPVLEPLRWADWEKMNVRWGIQQFNIKGAPPDVAPSMKAASIGSMLTGSRAHKIIGDDIETPKNSATVELREHLMAQIGEFESILLPGGTVDILGTPQSEESVYNVMVKRGYSRTMWPVRVPTESEMEIYGSDLSKLIQQMVLEGKHSEPTEPQRFPEEELIKKEGGMTRAAWRLQMMLDTSLADADKYPLKLNDLVTMELDKNQAPMVVSWSGMEKHRAPMESPGFSGDYLVNPMFTGENWQDYDNKFMMIDPSGRGDNETVWFVLGTLAGRIFVLDWGGTLDGYSEETLDLVSYKAKEHQVTEVVYEDNFGDGMFGTILGAHIKAIYPIKISAVKSHGQKEKRIIDTLEPVVRSHKLILNQSSIRSDISTTESTGYSLMYQYTRITYDRGCLRWDDRLDCLALGVNHAQKFAGVNSEEAFREAKEKAKEQALEELLGASFTFETQASKLTRNLENIPKTMGRPREKIYWRK